MAGIDTTRAPGPEAASIVSRLRAALTSGRTRVVAWLRAQLRSLRSLLTDHAQEPGEALRADLGKSPTEAYTTEIGFTVYEIDHALAHLNAWTRPRRTGVALALAPARARLVREPLGTVLIISPWNYRCGRHLHPWGPSLVSVGSR